ncbi:MAG: hypothetical protein DMG96_25140 [Acidobacteria bacterium]|nr:MAG: hypothetical protein DMG96_25140 [Acidobacteriota bacterium]
MGKGERRTKSVDRCRRPQPTSKPDFNDSENWRFDKCPEAEPSGLGGKLRLSDRRPGAQHQRRRSGYQPTSKPDFNDSENWRTGGQRGKAHEECGSLPPQAARQKSVYSFNASFSLHAANSNNRPRARPFQRPLAVQEGSPGSKCSQRLASI